MDGEPLIERPMSDNAAPFAEMARKIGDNASNGFGGAFVVMPPGGGEKMDLLLVNEPSDASVFWGLLKTMCEMRINDLNDQAARLAAGPYGRR